MKQVFISSFLALLFLPFNLQAASGFMQPRVDKSETTASTQLSSNVIAETEASSYVRAYVKSLGDRVKNVTYFADNDGVAIEFNNPETPYSKSSYVNSDAKTLAISYKNPVLRGLLEEALNFGEVYVDTEKEPNIVVPKRDIEFVADNVAKINYVFPNGQVLDTGEHFFELVLPEKVGFSSEYEINVNGHTYTGEIYKMEWVAYDEASNTNFFVYGGWLK